ncbi:beta-aspartyl-peptidase [Rossellomorea marisflavi]|uniref:beta-aspartyl-peptidase n=1 Tax=Rossellomorea marisflavi TaxID=189381 RepID=UPI00296F1430|nr:beta-aspartyl-peptidase [Rossellomorea marisflavi]MDW4528330.1 beta-aspartyl-peptidase [Rossellomorea marisflavi]
MLKLIKQTNVYTPQFAGVRDVLVGGGKILEIGTDLSPGSLDHTVIEANGMHMIPGLVDRHVHLTGGGGEGGFSSSTPEVRLSSLVKNGITTVVGLLGTNDVGRSTKSLLSKVKSLREEGMNAFMLTGGYGYPPNSITGDIREDIMFFSEVLGLKLAIEDHRASYVTTEELRRLASYVRVSSMLSKKKGFIHLHMGSGKGHYQQIYDVVESTDLPISLFSPTHINRTSELLDASVEFAGRGGLVDLTSNIQTKTAAGSLSPAQGVTYLLDKGVPMDAITVSSDANGSLPTFDENGQLIGLKVAGVEPSLTALQELVVEEGLPLEEAIKPFTVNPAKGLGLQGGRGMLVGGGAADFILLDDALAIRDVFINGEAFVEGYDVVKRGVFE